MKNALLKFVAVGFLAWNLGANAQEVKLGVDLGAIGSGGSSSIGFGVFFQVAPYENVGLRVDALTADINGGNYKSISPMLVFFAPTSEEFKAGLLLGGGFHQFTGGNTHFAIGGGGTAEFLVSKGLSIGGIVQYHSIFGSFGDVWNVMMTLNLTFGGASDGWNW